MAGVGVPPGLAGAGFGEVDDARANFSRIVNGMTRLREISENVAGDQLNVEKYVKDLSDVRTEMFRATGCMFEQEHFRFINMVAAVGNGGKGGGRGFKYPRRVVENKVIQNLKVVSGDKSLFRQWYQKFTTALGQISLEA